MIRKSYLTCSHKNVQEFTECCLDCGWNIYTTEEEYYEELKKEARRKKGFVPDKIKKLEDDTWD